MVQIIQMWNFQPKRASKILLFLILKLQRTYPDDSDKYLYPEKYSLVPFFLETNLFIETILSKYQNVFFFLINVDTI